jgi:hypothetical protein
MIELVETLLERTRAGAIEWRLTDLPEAYLYVGTTGSVIVRGRTDGPVSVGSGQFPSLSVLNAAGDTVESVVGGGLDRDKRRLIEDLLAAVAQQARDGDPLLDALRDEVAAAGVTGRLVRR